VAMQVDLQYEDNDTHSFTSLELAETKNLVTFQHEDSGNPHNWSHKYRAFIVFIGILTTLNSVLGSSLPSGYGDVIGEHFGVTGAALVLPISLWLCGYVFGKEPSLLFLTPSCPSVLVDRTSSPVPVPQNLDS